MRYIHIASTSLAILVNLTAAGSRESLRVDLNFSDCINCTIGMSAIASLPVGIPVVLYVVEANRGVIDTFLAQHEINRKRVTLRFVKENQTTSSTFTYTVNDKVVLNGPLKDFSGKVSVIVAIHEAQNVGTNSLNLQESLPVSNRLSYFTDGKMFIVTDYVTGKCFQLDIGANEPIDWTEIQIAPTLVAEMRDSLGIDPAMYEYVVPLLRNVGKFEPRFDAASFLDGSLFLSVKLVLPYVEATGDTALANYSVLLQLKGKDVIDFWFVNPEVYRKYEGHAFDAGDSFQVLGNGKVLLPLFKGKDDNAPSYLMAEASLDSGELRMLGFSSFRRPAYFDSLGYAHNFGQIRINSTFAFMRSYPALLDHRSGTAFNLKDAFESFYMDSLGYRIFPFHFLDWRGIDNDHAAVLLGHRLEVHHAIVNTTNGRVLFTELLNLKNADMASLQFNASKGMLALSKDRSAVLRIGAE